MSFRSKYYLADMSLGETKQFSGLSPREQTKIRRSAHNYNIRSSMYFTTRILDDVVYVTRVR